MTEDSNETKSAKKSLFSDAPYRIGDSVIFGSFEQDRYESNGKEPIEWIVLDASEESSKMLIISKNALYYYPYDRELDDRKTTWEQSMLRNWLNNDFFENAFSEQEKNHILESEIIAENNPKRNTPAGNNTYDKIFLLSMKEAEKYFINNSSRKCYATEYALEKDESGFNRKSDEYCWWWLRTPGEGTFRAACVNKKGEISDYGDLAIIAAAVRPALWVNCSDE